MVADFDALITCISACLIRPLRAYTPQGYKTPTAEKARPVRAATTTPTSAQLSSIPLSSSAPKAFYGKSRQSGWQADDTSPSPSNANTTSSSDSSNSKKYVGDGELQMICIIFTNSLYFLFLEHHKCLNMISKVHLKLSSILPQLPAVKSWNCVLMWSLKSVYKSLEWSFSSSFVMHARKNPSPYAYHDHIPNLFVFLPLKSKVLWTLKLSFKIHKKKNRLEESMK